jgi:hypothetical protein
MKIDDLFFTHKSVAQPLNHGAEVQLGDSYFIFLLPKNAQSNHLNPIYQEEDEKEIELRKKKLNEKFPSEESNSFEKPTLSYATMMYEIYFKKFILEHKHFLNNQIND